MGVVIGETAEIGNWVMLYQGVTLGGTASSAANGIPRFRDDVIIGVGASVLGAITIGRGARVGGGAVVVKDVHLVAGEGVRKRCLLPLVANVPDQVVFESMITAGHVEGTPQHRHVVVDGLRGVEARAEGQHAHDVRC